MAKLISSTYADALFELAIEQNKTGEWKEEIEAIKTILHDNPQFGELMSHPRVLKEEKLKLAEEAFAGKADPEIVGLIRIIIEKDRYNQIDAIFDDFIDSVKEHEGIGVAWVTTAMELTQAQKDAVEKKLLDTTDYKTMEMHYLTDESVIAGMTVRIGDRVVDSTVRTRLNDLTRSLLRAQV
ncbi:MAG: ATP synthase F1 subunit delta [Lachnospiraceae bacterium]|nr:ATP synthase F1 subunit delta [Lachnospiraceae bacterium]MCR4595974.1 ATP synthase F1 subunit delta [Lachnospiraceae bacterium]